MWPTRAWRTNGTVATTAADLVLVVDAAAQSGYAKRHRFVGPSPLHAHAADLAFTGISIEIRPADPTGLDHGLGGLRTPVHVEGHIIVVADDGCARAEGAPRTSSC